MLEDIPSRFSRSIQRYQGESSIQGRRGQCDLHSLQRGSVTGQKKDGVTPRHLNSDCIPEALHLQTLKVQVSDFVVPGSVDNSRQQCCTSHGQAL